ncbi:MAG: HAD family hydrolase [Aminipila sp.]
MHITGAIFDLDGTLLDSMAIWETIAVDYLRLRGIEPTENLNETFKAMSLQQSAQYYQRHYNIVDSTDKIIEDINKMIESFYINEVQPKRGVKCFLENLKNRNTKMIVATAIDKHIAKAALTRCNLLDYFEDILTCREIGCGKDKPDIYIEGLSRLKTKKESTWVFEDSIHALNTAKLAGFPVVGVYDKSEIDSKSVCSIADMYINSFEEMEGLK